MEYSIKTQDIAVSLLTKCCMMPLKVFDFDQTRLVCYMLLSDNESLTGGLL
jgi:hypothetical protein